MSTQVKSALQQTIQSLKTAPEQAQVVFEATAQLGSNVQVSCQARGFKIQIDEPHSLGGDDTAANPVEMVLASLGACQAIVYRALASLKGIELESVEVKAVGSLNLQGFLGLNQSVRPGFEYIEFHTTITSTASKAKLVQLSKQVEQLCPVLDVIENRVPVKGKLCIVKK